MQLNDLRQAPVELHHSWQFFHSRLQASLKILLDDLRALLNHQHLLLLIVEVHLPVTLNVGGIHHEANNLRRESPLVQI